MAIVQISRITQRKGLAENLPQLAGAELGWAIDDRRLFIGNGTLAEGAPTVGNTEILTEYSDLLSLAKQYTYKGDAAGYTVQTGPTTSDPVTRSFQAVFDDYACVKDFGAVGDGVTDDTAAINRALFQLYCREINTAIRRSLFFPAGTYRITDTLLVPPFARLLGEGANSSIIVLDVDSAAEYAIRTSDSLQQTGNNIGSNGATVPQLVEITDMAFSTEKVSDIFLIEDTEQVYVQSCNFYGPYTTATLTSSADDVACVRFNSSLSLVTNHVTFDGCRFSGMIYGTACDKQIQGIVFVNSKFDTLYQGAVFGTGTVENGGAVGVRLTQNTFDMISYEGIIFGNIQNNVSGYNIFLDVGNEFQGSGSPASAIIEIQNNNNVSVGDMFERNDTDNAIHPRIELNNYQAWALDKGERYKFGSYNREAGGSQFLYNAAVDTEIFNVPVAQVNGAFIMEYRYQDAITSYIRYGRMTVVGEDGSGTLAFNDDFVENSAIGFTLTPSMSGSNIVMSYLAAASEGYFSWSLSHF